MKKLFCFALFLSVHTLLNDVQAQSFPEQECSGALPICRTSITVRPGYPRVPQQPTYPCLGRVESPVWYLLEAAATGDFGFTLTPTDPTDDYDWAVYDISERGCSSIAGGTARILSCNTSPAMGATGPNGMGTSSNVGAGAGQPPFNALIPVQRGGRYALVISHFLRRTFPRGTNSGFTLDFGVTAAGIITAPPADSFRITRAVPITTACGASGLRVTFSEPILCGSVKAAGMSISGFGNVFSDVVEVASEEFGTISENPDPVLSARFDRTFIITPRNRLNRAGLYTLTASGLATACRLSNRASATVEVMPFAPRVDIFGNLLFCGTNGTTLFVANDFETYRWTDSAGTVLSEKSSVTVNRAGTYRVVVTNSGACMATSSATVAVRTNPTLNVAGARAFCDGDCLYLVADAGYDTYEWLDSAGSVVRMGREQCLTLTGLFSVRASGNGCEVLSQPFRLTRIPSPSQVPSVIRRGNLLTASSVPDTSFYIEWRRRIGSGRYDYTTVGFGQSYTPLDTGRYVAALFNRSGCWTESAEVVFRPVSASAVLAVGSVSAAQNQLVSIPILLKNAQNLATLNPDSLRVQLRFNARLLFPEDPRIQRFSIDNRDRLVELTLPIQALRGDTLAAFRFRTMLGNTTATVLALQNINTVPPNLGLRATAESGVFMLTNVSTSGSIRLIGGRTTLVISSRPNPIVEIGEMTLNLSSDAFTKVMVSDMYGRVVAILVDGELPQGENRLTFDARALTTGAYTLICQTIPQKKTALSPQSTIFTNAQGFGIANGIPERIATTIMVIR